MYGCTKDIMDQVEMWLRQFKRSAFHPFMFPMIFAEIERKRLLTPLRNSNTKNLKARVEELENRLRNEGRWNRSSGSEKNDARLTLMQRDCEDTKAWDSVNKIKNGIESLIVVLESMDKSMDKELKTVCGGDPILGVGTTEEQQKQAKRTELIQARLAEIIFELQCKVRDCKGLLGGMALATQMVRVVGDSTLKSQQLTGVTTGVELPRKARRQDQQVYCIRIQERQCTDEVHFKNGDDLPTWDIPGGK